VGDVIINQMPDVQICDQIRKRGYQSPKTVAGKPFFDTVYWVVPVYDNCFEVSNYPIVIGNANGSIHDEVVSVHRPTPEGMKQVWPEVEGNGSTFKEALEATIDKYGDALARLAGTQEAEHDPN
jgi:hypothetical protein